MILLFFIKSFYTTLDNEEMAEFIRDKLDGEGKSLTKEKILDVLGYELDYLVEKKIAVKK